MKRILPVALALILFSACLSAFARASDQLDTYSVTVSPQGGGVVKVKVYVKGTHWNMTKIGFPTTVLYEYNNGQWEDVDFVSLKFNPNVPAGSYEYSFTYQGTAGKSYYAYSSFLAEDDEGSDSRTLSSKSEKAT